MRQALGLIAVITFAVGAGTGCDTPSFGSRLSNRQIEIIGSRAAQEMDAQYVAAPPTDPGMANFDVVAPKIAKAAAELSKGPVCQFKVVETDDQFALSLPDGHVYIGSGLLARIADDPDEIACVLAHEAGHVALGHDVEQLKSALGDSTISDMLSEGKYQDVTNIQLELSRLTYTKDEEFDADRYMVRIVAAAGYDPSAMLRFLKMIAQGPHLLTQVSWDDSHPMPKSRISRLQDDIRNEHLGK